ncbi:hypothetical protein CcaCcLH18_06924 [Colletotrichum camelliae]|nr:hypothetical protein CcaCcLH18_06924 [Colletotrichum camelliae]
MKSSICLLIASSVLALAAPASKDGRSIYTYAVKDYEKEADSQTEDAVAARSIYTYAVKDYEKEADSQAEDAVEARSIYTYAVKDYEKEAEAEN